MKKSDIAIYISAILTLVLTTFVVFSTQKVTYENKIDEILSTKNQQMDKSLVKNNDNIVSPLFKTKIDKADNSILKTSVTIADKKTDDLKIKAVLKKSFANLNDFNRKITKKSKNIKSTKTKKQAFVTRNFYTGNTSTKKKSVVTRSHTRKRMTSKKRTSYSHSANSRTYVVRSGDTMWKIAQRHNISTISLIRKNALRNPNLIYPGMKIKV